MSEGRETSQKFPKYEDGNFKSDLQEDYYLSIKTSERGSKKRIIQFYLTLDLKACTKENQDHG